jgi:hypothetical protein
LRGSGRPKRKQFVRQLGERPIHGKMVTSLALFGSEIEQPLPMDHAVAW